MIADMVISIIEEIAPLKYAAKWDRSGQQVAAARENVSHMALCLDATPEQVRACIELGADFILSHHPLTLVPGLPNKLDAYHEVLRLLLRANVPLYAAHTSLDINLDGPAGWLGRELNLSDQQVLERVNPLHEEIALGFGGIGSLPEPLPLKTVAKNIMGLLNLDLAIFCGPKGTDQISSVAWCGGSGASLVDEAQRRGAGIFVTGDIKYHSALEAQIPVMDVGHHSLEEEMMRRFAIILQKRLPEIRVSFLPSISPFRFFSLQNC